MSRQAAQADAPGRPIASLALSTALLAFGLCPLPDGFLRAARDSARSMEMNRADRAATAGGYYEGLIGEAGGPQGSRGELALRLLGRPEQWGRFADANVSRALPGDLLQFELLPNQSLSLFGQPFTTNSAGMRDRACTQEKPAGVFRVALLGSSIDMGWGVGTEETYENRFENWLNTHAQRRGLARRFEVLNFAMAAYGPVQRLESYRRKAAAYHPDLVVYAATMLDLRLLEIHLCDSLKDGADLKYDFVRGAVAHAGLAPSDLARDAEGEFVNKDAIKAKLQPYYWTIIDATVGTLAADCRAAGVPLWCVIIPRVGEADAPAERAGAVARHHEIAARHGVPVLDLSGAFDHKDPAAIEIAAWDDHPNALGHKLLFRTLARALVANPPLYETVFGVRLPGGEEGARLSKSGGFSGPAVLPRQSHRPAPP